MIVGAIMSLVKAMLGLVFDLLPTSSIPGLDAGAYSATMYEAGSSAAAWNSYVPVVFVMTTTASVFAVLLPAVVIYKVANWTWRHIPSIAGFGPGAG